MKDLTDLYNELEKYNIPIIKVDFQNKKAGKTVAVIQFR